jgi:predicted dehydrogenase
MRFLLFGAGSIGQRHLKNLLDLGHQVVAVFDPDPACRGAVEQGGWRALVTGEEEQAWGREADAALVCSPSVYHLGQARRAVAKGLHVFIEKPLSPTLDQTEALVVEAAAAGRVVLVGCNLRFFPSLQRVKRLLDEGSVGRPLSARAQCGYYLPYWRPNTDYRNGYGARRAVGGGVILDSIHEFDYLSWMLGEPVEVFAYAGKVSSLEIDTEDNADVLIRFASGAVASVHLDYLQRTYRRSCELIGEEGVIVWDYITQAVTVYGKQDRRCEVFAESINAERNQMYVQEMKHFARSIAGEEQPMLDAAGGRAVLEIALAAKRSAATQQVVRIRA